MAETIISTEYSGEMQQAYINYSMSVIMARAVPDIRDGLKPVQRRVLYAMNELGLNSDKPHRKSARIVGDAMGKYHPHGDSSIYESLVVLSQDFKKGMALVDGHGNFGSIEGDGAAAMRYTEARLKKFTQEVYLADLDKNVVDFIPNFDETEKEPEVLPVRIPNFLVNGSEGIAVGMTTSVPTHNLAEVVDAMIAVMDHPDITIAELMGILHGPDFPTGGIVTNQSDLLSIYETGKGKIKLRGKASIEYAQKKSDRDRIVITEIPYTMVGANIGKFLNDVASLVETKKLPDISDISNQSSKEGIKIVLELKKGANAEKILQGLYKKTKLEDTFGVNMLAIADGKPEVLNLKRILEYSIHFQVDLNTRKYTTLLDKERSKKEVQEGLIQAVDIIDLIIEIIRGSKTLKIAKNCLITGNTDEVRFKTAASKQQASKLCFTENQATAILELRLSKLIGLEILSLQEDYRQTLHKIETYETILGSQNAMMKTIKQDLVKIKKTYGLPRKTEICNAAEAVFEEAPVVEQDVIFTMNRFGYVKMMEPAVFERNETAVREESRIMISCRNTSKICIFTDVGTMHQLKMMEVPLCRPKDKGIPIENICNYDSSKETICLMDSFESLIGKHLLFVTQHAMVKQVLAEEFETIKKTVVSTKLNEHDKLFYVGIAEKDSVALLTTENRILKFKIDDISILKKASVGVRGMKLMEGEQIKEVYCINSDESYSIKPGRKKINLSDLKLKKRDAKPEQL
ncbi:MAG: DNA topoisomerase (ATP-hydrolyzing) subunit A [Lachnospiraceae bacterium]